VDFTLSYLFNSLFLCPSMSLSISLSISQYVSLPLCLSVSLSLCLSVSLSLCLSVSLSLCLLSIHDVLELTFLCSTGAMKPSTLDITSRFSIADEKARPEDVSTIFHHDVASELCLW
jgi:hypothetical protein